jgi:hypothetical protein
VGDQLLEDDSVDHNRSLLLNLFLRNRLR